MKQALITSYVKATGKRGSRIKVKAVGHSVTYPFDAAISVEENHALAAGHYVYDMNKMRGGDGRVWTITDGGSTPDCEGYAFIITLGTV
jgi:hypothetical protein